MFYLPVLDVPYKPGRKIVRSNIYVDLLQTFKNFQCRLKVLYAHLAVYVTCRNISVCDISICIGVYDLDLKDYNKFWVWITLNLNLNFKAPVQC